MVIAVLWLGWLFSKPGSSQQLGMVLPEALAFLTGTHATVEQAMLSWDPAQKRLSLRWENAVFASPHQPGVLSVRHLAAEMRYGWQENHFLTIDFLKLDQPQLFLPKYARTTRSDPFLIPALKTLEHLHWPFAFLRRLQVTGGYAELGRQQVLAKINLSFAAAEGQTPLLLLSGHWLKGETVIPFRLRAEELPNRQFDLRVIAESARILSPQFKTGEVFLADARAHLLLEPQARRLTLSALRIETADVPVAARAVLHWNNDLVKIRFATQADAMDLGQLERLWPLHAGIYARTWVMQHLTEGRVQKALVRGQLLVPLVDPARTHVESLEGTLDLADFQVAYLEGMPPVTGVSGRATFDARDFIIQVQSGVSQGVALQGGTLKFTAHPELGYSLLDLQLQLAGALADQLAIVRTIPAVRKTTWGFPPEAVAGSGTTDLAMHIPLELKHEHRMTLDATAKLSGVGLPLAGGRFRLMDADALVKASLLSVSAEITGKMNGVPVTVDWLQPLKGADSWTASLRGSGDAALWDSLAGVEVSRYASGPLAVAGQVDGAGNVTLRAALTDAALAIPVINWQKAAGEAASLDLGFDVKKNLYRFDYTGKAEQMRGTLMRDAAGDLQNLTLAEGRIGRSQMQGEISKQNTGEYKGKFTAAGLDVSGLIGPDATPKPEKKLRTWGWTSLPPMQIEARIANLWLDKDAAPATATELSLSAAGKGLERVVLRGLLPEAKGFAVNIFPDANSQHEDLRLLATAEDAGIFLRTLGLYQNIRGGKLELAARLPRTGTVNADGTLRISAFSLMRAPVLARLLSVASLTGPLNLLTGQGIAFDGLYAEWSLLEDDRLKIRKGLMAGTALGLQAEGTVNLAEDTFDLNGAIVPVYVLSNVIGNIPILGDILTNNQKEGLIAMRYQMRGPMEDPNISVNPLTVLTPGFLRGFFDIFKAAPPPDAPQPE